MKFSRSLKQLLWVVPFLVGIAGAQTAEAAGPPNDLRMHLKFSDTAPEVKFTDASFQDRKVKICPNCRVEVKNDSGKTLYVSMDVLDGRVQYVFITEPDSVDSPRPAYDVPSSVAALSIYDGDQYFSADGVTYQDMPVNPVKSMTVSAELDPVAKMNFINQYGGDGSKLNYQFAAEWIVEKNQVFKVEMSPGENPAPSTLRTAGYVRFDLDPNGGKLFEQNSFLSFYEKDATTGTTLPIHSGVTEVRLEGKAPHHYPAIPFRVMAWQSAPDAAAKKLMIVPYEGEDPIYHQENHEWVKLTVKRGAVVTSYDLKPKTTLTISSGPEAGARYTKNGNAGDFENFPKEYAVNFSVTGNELKVGIIGESTGPQLAPNQPGEDPVVFPGNFVAPPMCLHCKPVIDDLKNPEVNPDGDDENGDDQGNGDTGNADSENPAGDDGAKGGSFGENASAGGCNIGPVGMNGTISWVFGAFLPGFWILLRQRRS